uniref:Apolipoprotein B n=1 Tax=Pavo cristatus TaxID=9049 RepID=A0A8C9L7S2_PAVCR
MNSQNNWKRFKHYSLVYFVSSRSQKERKTVELEVPQLCQFILRTMHCSLRETFETSVINQDKTCCFRYNFYEVLILLDHDLIKNSLIKAIAFPFSSITIQALIQCGTPECYSAVLQILRTGNVNPLVVDLVTYTLGLLPSPTPKRIREILNMAQYQPSRASLYGLSHACVNSKTKEITDVADFMVSLLGTDCSGDAELTYLTLRAIGNMGAVMEKAKPSLKASLKTCIRNQAASLSVQKAAIQAFRKMTITEEDRSALLKEFQEGDAPTDKRLATYLMLMKNPSPSDLTKIMRILTREKNEQVKSFVASHIANILDSDEVGIEELKSHVEEALKGNEVPTAKDFRKFSQNYQVSKRVSVPGLNPVLAKVEGNVIFDPNSYVPKETMLKTTLNVYGFGPSDIFELGLDGKGFEPTLEALFGEKGFFPDTASKALYWVDGKVPEQVSKALFDYFGYSHDGKQDQEITKAIILNLEKLIKELSKKEAPEGRAFLRILGEELGYMKLNDFKLLGSMVLECVKTLQRIPEMRSPKCSLVVNNKTILYFPGVKQHEATLTFKYNRDRKILTSDVSIPDVDVDFGTNFRITDESVSGKKAYTFVIDVNNKKISEVTLTGQIRYAGIEEAMLRGTISIPRLQTELRTEALVNYSPTKGYLQMSSAVETRGNTISKRVLLRYDSEKAELEWNLGASAPVGRMSSGFQVDFSDYSKTLEKYANELLDRKVALTDMTMRHIVSQFIVATNTWLQKASKDVPYAQTLQAKLRGLQELNIQKIKLPVITIPEELFLKSEGRIKYSFNKNSFLINIPLPFGGRSSHDIRVPQTVKTPRLVIESVGINIPSQEYRMPTFTVPESYPLLVPLFGALEVSASVHSNYYNWTAAYTLANSSTEKTSRIGTTYTVNADSVFELLSYNMKEGQLEVASVFARSIYTMSSSYNEKRRVLEGKSNLRLDSSYLQATNHLSGRYTDGVFSITSASDVQNGLLKNTASLKYENSQLKITSETNGRYLHLAAVNKLEFLLSKKMAALRSEYQATYKQTQCYALFAGSLNSQDLVFNTDFSLTDQRNRAAHKSSLNINQYGLASSATTNVQFSPLTMQSEMNAKLDTSGGSMSLSSSGRYGKNNAKFNLGGRVSLTEITLGSEYQSTVLGMDNKHVLNFRINREGLKFSNNLQGSFKEIKLEYTNDLNIPGLSLTFVSKLDNSFSFDKFHKHVFDLQLQPRSLTAKLNNNIKYTKTEVSNKAELLLEPLKLNLGGNVRAAYGTDEVRHTYTITYADLTANFKTDTVANVQGAAVSHRVNLNVAGLASSITMNTNCDSKSLRFSNALRSTMAPFTITADIHTNGNGKLIALGEHTGDLYSKILFKAEPLAFTFSHDYRGSTSHSFKSVRRYTTQLDNKFHMLFTPSEQSSAWKLKSQLNNNIYSQDINAYNDAEKIGVELSGRALADLSVMDTAIGLPFTSEEVNVIDVLGLRDSMSEPQEFSISGSVKYDKNKDMHVINIPFLEHLPVYFEQIRGAILSVLQAVQNYLKNIDVDQYMKKYKATLDEFPQHLGDYMDTLDLKGRVSTIKTNLIAFTKDYRITSDDLEIILEKALDNLQEILLRLQVYLVQIEQYIKENYDQFDINALIAQLLDKIVEKMTALDEKYKIRMTVVDTIQKLQFFFNQYYPSNIGSSTMTWIKNVDDEYRITSRIQENLEQLKIQIQNIDIRSFAENLKRKIKMIDVKQVLEKLKRSLPIKKMKEVLEQIKDFILSWMEEYEVSEKINAFRGHMHKLIVKYEIDKHVYFLLDRMVELLNQYRIKETVRKMMTYLRKMDVKTCCDKIVAFIDDAVKKVQTFEYEMMIKKLNKFLDMIIKKLKSFDYNQFVDDTNNKIQEMTQKINEELRNLELPQKAEALKQYIRDFSAVVSKYIEQLRDTKLVAIINWLKELIDSTTFTNLKAKVNEHLEDLRERISDMDISKEFEWYLQKISQFYNSVVIYISEQWNIAFKKIVTLAEKYDLKNWAENLNQFIETGFQVPEIRTVIVTIPAFEFSLRSLREATFRTPDFIVPLTDLKIPSYEINIKRLKDIKIPAKFTTPEFTVLNSFKVPSYTIDLNEIKFQIVRMIDQLMSGEFQLPAIDLYFKDLKMRDMPFSAISFPELQMPQLEIPELLIPKLNLNEFQIPDLKIPEFQLPRIPHTVTAPTFGKLSGSFRVASPFFTLSTQAEVHNTTTSANSPEFVTSLSAQATSRLDFLVFSVVADSHILAPEMKQLKLKNSMKVSHKFLKVDHTNEVVFLGTSVSGEAETRAKFSATKNSIELQNNLMVNLQRKIQMQSGTAYSHRLSIPQADFSSQADLVNNMTTDIEAGRISFTSNGKGNWKWTSPNFSDEGTHNSHATFRIDGPVLIFFADYRINDRYLKVSQSMRYECGFLSYATLQVQSEIESQRVGRSILNVKGTGQLGGMKVELTGSHNARLNGRITGTVNNEFFFLAQPFEIRLLTNNDGNVKISFPMKLTGKIDFLNNYGLSLSSSVQQVNWQATGRFNQYRYSHNMSAGNNDDRIEAHVEMSGDANLDFLNIPLTIPQLHIPYIGIQTPQLKDYSLWEQAGLRDLLKTTRQSFDLNLNAQYEKNKDMHVIPLPLATVHEALNKYIIFFNKYFERGRNTALDFLTKSYNEAKTKFDKYKIQTSLNKLPRTFRIPGYTIPIVNIEVSPFTAEMPAFGYMLPKEISTTGFTVPFIGFSVPSYTLVLPSLELPVLHVPQDLRTLKLPRFRINSPSNQILIPAMGNITYDFSFKSSVITLTANAGLFNQSDIAGHLSVSSSSVIDALQFQLDGSTSLTRKRGLKLATALSLNNNKFLGGSHDHTISLTKRNLEASMMTNAKINTPIFKMNFSQELSGNTKSKPTISSGLKVTYDFSTPRHGISAKGGVAHKLALETLTSYLSVETSTKGNIDGAIYTGNSFSGALDHEANTYLHANGVRSSLKLAANSKVDGLWNSEMKEILAVEATISRVYAVWEHSGKNYARYTPLFTTTGSQKCKATFELASWTMSADLQIQAAQPNSFLDTASVNQVVLMKISSTDQKVGWKGEGQIQSLSLRHDMQLSNEKSNAKFDISGSLEGYVDFLKRINCPISKKSLWDILKLDVTTVADRKQYLNASASFKYTKSDDGYFFPMPVIRLSDGFTFSIPELHLKAPSPVLSTPEFRVPFSTLQVPAYTIDLRNIKIPQTLNIMPFDVNLPTLPKLRFPRVDVGANYITLEEYKIPYFEVTVPEYQITVSQFTLPKSISLGSFHVDLDKVANKIADFDLPTITIPEQKIEIPPLKVSLPAGIYIPSFGHWIRFVYKIPYTYLVLCFQSAPQKDIDILKSEISFRNSDMIQITFNWKEDAAKDLLLGLKEKVPKMTSAVYKCVNRYYKEHMGLDISDATVIMKNMMQDNADKAYMFAVRQIDQMDVQLRTAANEASDKYQEIKVKARQLYKRAADQAEQIDYQRIKAKLLDATVDLMEEYHKKIKHLIDSVIEFLKTTKFQVPGLSEKYTGEELYLMTTEKAAKTADICFSKLQEYFDALIAAINELEVRVPASETILRGRNVLDQIKEMLKHLQEKIRQTFVTLQEADFAGKLNQLKQVVQKTFQKAGNMVRIQQLSRSMEVFALFSVYVGSSK